MSDEIKNQDVTEVEDLSVSPIEDEDLEGVAGGLAQEDGCTGCNVTGCCTSGAADAEMMA